MIALLLTLQAAAAQPPPQRISILAPVPTEPCRRRPETEADEIVVCASPESTQRLPLPGERGPPDRPMPSNPDVTGMGALQPTPCAAVQSGCQAGVDLFGIGAAAVRLVGKLIDPNSCCDEPGQATNVVGLAADAVGGVKKLFAGKSDKSKRVPINLDAPPPGTAGRILP